MKHNKDVVIVSGTDDSENIHFLNREVCTRKILLNTIQQLCDTFSTGAKHWLFVITNASLLPYLEIHLVK